MAECGAGPRRRAEMRGQWRMDNQSLMVVDKVADKSYFPAMCTVIVMEDYNSLGPEKGYAWGDGLDRDSVALALGLGFV
eukprot:4678335-Lingulodinium_polyedra.AAC.1